MCGIVGIHALSARPSASFSALEMMLGMIRHRGPDEAGIYRDEQTGLGTVRLSIIDVEGGTQPISNEDGTVWVVFNGEIFNHPELRKDLESRGHRFSTASDTEVIVHLYEEYGPECVTLFNGQFAIALWDRRDRTLLLARDRVGIRPLYYTVKNGALVFGSEIKALLAHPDIDARIDIDALTQVLTLWSTIPPTTPFQDIQELPPGHILTATRGQISVRSYWNLPFSEDDRSNELEEADYAERLGTLLADATRIRLRADVPVGAYLSGGLDSSTIAAFSRSFLTDRLRTFSVAFADPAYDERVHQERMTDALGTAHSRIECTTSNIADAFPDAVWHAEWPLLRTAPVPMFLLSELVHREGLKVVLTGEGADEFLGGYDIFKETKIRRFWARDPQSKIRPLLLQRLYPYVQGLSDSRAFLEAFFRKHLTETDRLDYSHVLRWENTAGLRRLLAPHIRERVRRHDPVVDMVALLDRHPAYRDWSSLAKAQFLEALVFMPEYLLSSQGDRMLMAHSVEGRYPFLDHRVIAFAASIPARLKIKGLNEKFILKQAVEDLLPASVLRRGKEPYRAPIAEVLLGPNAPDCVMGLLSPDIVAASGYFDVLAVQRLITRSQNGAPLSERDTMGVAAVISTQLLHHQFVEHFPYRRAASFPLNKVVDLSTKED